jgi:hypothetical protein
MSFGFSVGDFLAVGTLLFKIGATLRDSTGSSAHYQELLLQIDSFEKLLKIVDCHIVSCQLPSSTERALKEHVSNCAQLLQKFYKVTEKFKRSLRQGGSGKYAKDTWRKIGWGMYKKEDIVPLLNGLRDNGDAMNLLLLCDER